MHIYFHYIQVKIKAKFSDCHIIFILLRFLTAKYSTIYVRGFHQKMKIYHNMLTNLVLDHSRVQLYVPGTSIKLNGKHVRVSNSATNIVMFLAKLFAPHASKGTYVRVSLR